MHTEDKTVQWFRVRKFTLMTSKARWPTPRGRIAFADDHVFALAQETLTCVEYLTGTIRWMLTDAPVDGVTE